MCPYCGVGCRLRGEISGGRIERVQGVLDAPANLGAICAKGVTLPQTIDVTNRLRQPLLRSSRNAPLEPVSWEVALDVFARRFGRMITDYGADRVAFYGSGQLDTEAAYCITKLFKGHLGTNHIDSNSRLCMAAPVAGYVSNLGSDGPPCCYDDIEAAEVILIIGSNMAEAHPVTFDRIKAPKRRNPQMRIIVVDPRRTPTADAADIHLAVRPFGDIALLSVLSRLLLEAGKVDERFITQHTTGFENYCDGVGAAPLEELVNASGVPLEQLRKAADALVGTDRFLSFYCMGIGQSTVGMWNVNSLVNLHLLTGTINRPGCGPFSLTGQPNAMGCREVGLLSHQLPGYRFVENPDHRAQVEAFWGYSRGRINDRPGLTAVEMFRALERGRLKAIWIAATNPLVSLPDLHQVRPALERAEFVVVQDAYHPTEPTLAADLVLPAASWGEKEGTTTNSEQ